MNTLTTLSCFKSMPHTPALKFCSHSIQTSVAVERHKSQLFSLFTTQLAGRTQQAQCMGGVVWGRGRLCGQDPRSDRMCVYRLSACYANNVH